MDLITDEEKKTIGEDWAKYLLLREARDIDGKRYKPKRWQTQGGNKTALGIYNTIVGLVDF